MRKYKRINKKLFDQAKLLLKAGLKRNKVATLTEASWTTIDFIGKSTSVEDYKKQVKEYNQKRFTKPEEQMTPVGKAIKGGLEQLNRESHISELKQIKSILLRIDSTLRLATDGERKLRFR